MYLSLFSPLALSCVSVFNMILPYPSWFCWSVSVRCTQSICPTGVTSAPTFFLQLHCCFNSLLTEHLKFSWCLYCCRCIVKPSSNTAISWETPQEEQRTREKWTYLNKQCQRDEIFWSCQLETFDCITGSRWGQISDFSANLWVFTVAEDECFSVSGDEKS